MSQGIWKAGCLVVSQKPLENCFQEHVMAKMISNETLVSMDKPPPSPILSCTGFRMQNLVLKKFWKEKKNRIGYLQKKSFFLQ